MLVCGQHFSEEVIREISATVESEPTISRRSLSRKVCEWLNWRGANGKLKTMSCCVALLKLHRQGIVKLPECTVKGLFEPKKENDEPIEQIEPVSCDLNQLGGVELTLKSGCKIEERQLGHADRIEACLAIDMVVAWRIFHLTKLGRETPMCRVQYSLKRPSGKL